MAASSDALEAFQIFALDPVGKLAPACASLGPVRTLGAGVTYGIASALGVLLAIYSVLPPLARPPGLVGIIKILAVAIVPILALFTATAAARSVFRAEGDFRQDSFIAGASALPFGGVAVLATILGVGNFEVISVAALFASCVTILMLFAGLTRICRASERSATLAIPLMLIITMWLSKVIYASMLEHAF